MCKGATLTPKVEILGNQTIHRAKMEVVFGEQVCNLRMQDNAANQQSGHGVGG